LGFEHSATLYSELTALRSAASSSAQELSAERARSAALKEESERWRARSDGSEAATELIKAKDAQIAAVRCTRFSHVRCTN
jgi:hypothetical protein